MIILYSCTSTPKAVNKVNAEGGSSHDTINIAAGNSDRAYIFESLNAEGGSSHDTIYLRSKTRAKLYMIRDFQIKKKP